MANLSDITYTICEFKDENNTSVATAGESKDKLKIVSETQYLIEVSTERVGGGAPITPADVSTVLITSIPELPKVNGHTWSSGGLTNPYLVCRDRQCNRDKSNGLLFHVSATFESDELDEEKPPQDPPANLTDITPVETARIGTIQRVMYKDKDEKDCFRLPTGTPFQEPVMETVPTLTLTITQYEPSITYQQMLDRSFKLNASTYRSRDAGSWLIGEVQATEVTVQLAGGPTLAAKVVYPITLSEAVFKTIVNEEPPGTTIGDDYFYGWMTARPLADNWYMQYDPDASRDILVPNKDPVTGFQSSGWIFQDGGGQRIPQPEGVTADLPSYTFFRTYDEIEFSFLQI